MTNTVLKVTAMNQPTTPYRGIDTDDHAGQGWKADALCNQVDPDLGFPDMSDTSRSAKRICADCPVTGECLDWALARDERFGVWGGLTVGERDKLRARSGRTA